MKRTSLCVAGALMFLFASAAPAAAATLTIGFFTFDAFIPDAPDAPGTVTFGVYNATGPEAFVVESELLTALTFSDLAVDVPGAPGSPFALPNLGPGPLDPVFSGQYPSAQAPTRATLSGRVSLAANEQLLLSGDRLFVPYSFTFSVMLGDGTNELSSLLDPALISLEGDIVAANVIPEPGTLLLLGSGVMLIARTHRGRRLRRR